MRVEISPLAPDEELIDVESFRRLHSRIDGAQRGSRPAPVAEPSDFASSWARLPLRAPQRPAPPPEIELVDRLTRQDVERIAVQRARSHAEAAAFFVARHGRIQATCCDPKPRHELGPIHWTDRRFTLASVLDEQTPYAGAPWRDALTSRITRSLGREGVRQIALIPISVYGRSAAFLYADSGGEPFAAHSGAALASICADVGGVFERMLVEIKRDQAG
jgi:hypothetical protein